MTTIKWGEYLLYIQHRGECCSIIAERIQADPKVVVTETDEIINYISQNGQLDSAHPITRYTGNACHE